MNQSAPNLGGVEMPKEITPTAKQEMEGLRPHIEAQRAETATEAEGRIFNEALVAYRTTIQATSQGTGDSEDDQRARQIALMKEKEKLQELVNLAFKEGPIYACQVASKIGDASLQDRLHDLLMKFHQDLVARGILEEI